MEVIIKNKESEHLSLKDLILHNFYLAVTKNKTHNSGKGRKAIIFIGENIGSDNRVHYFYQNEKYITHSNIEYLLENFEIKENVTEKCKLICEL